MNATALRHWARLGGVRSRTWIFRYGSRRKGAGAAGALGARDVGPAIGARERGEADQGEGDAAEHIDEVVLVDGKDGEKDQPEPDVEADANHAAGGVVVDGPEEHKEGGVEGR